MQKKTYKLKQITPIIHFQHDEGGDCFRATEFKPKFDKFIFANEEINKKNNLTIPKQEKALNYKMKIEVKGDIEKIIIEHDIEGSNRDLEGLYFANMGDESKHIQAVFCKGVIKIEFFSFNEEVLELIDKHMKPFLATNNFGTRQNKGFGGYYIACETDFEENILKTKELFLKKQADTQRYRAFSEIGIIYKYMKSGINFPQSNRFEKSYHKGFIYEYFLNKGIGNEKKEIKQKLIHEEDQGAKGFNKNPYYVRGILGVHQDLEFRHTRDHIMKTISITGENVERYKSPITFKVFKDHIYLLPENKEDINGEEFIFKYNGEEIPLKIPDNFVLNDFLCAFAKGFNSLDDTSARNPLEIQLNNARKHNIEIIKEGELDD